MALLPALLGAALVAAPLVSLVLMAVSGGSDALSTLAGSVLPDALRQTALLLGGVALLAGTIGAATAWLVTAYRFPGSRVLSWLLPLPMAVPTYVTALVYVELLDAAGPVRTALRQAFGRQVSDGWFPEVRSLPGCILLLSFVLYPYVFVALRASFLGREPSIAAAARVHGASPLRTFRHVALPLARPALAAGVTLVLLEALNDIGASEYLGVRTLTVSAYTAWLERGDLVGATQIACSALAVVALILLVEAASRERSGFAASAAATARHEPAPLDGWAAGSATLACAAPIAIGFVVPCAFLVREILRRDLVRTMSPAFPAQIGYTLAFAGAATLVVILWSVAIGIAGRSRPTRLARAFGGLAGFGYAVPGTVLVLGLLPVFMGADGLLSGAITAVSGYEPGLLLIGSGAGIVLAYTIRFMRIGTGAVAAQFAQIPVEVEHVARTLGARPRALARQIQLPLLRPAVAGAALLVFVDALKELPATLLLRPLNVETLATLVYGANSRGLFEDGALAALLIVLAGLGPVIWLTRATRVRATAPGDRPARAPQAALRADPSSATLKAASV